jgi:hypothetical protein
MTRLPVPILGRAHADDDWIKNTQLPGFQNIRPCKNYTSGRELAYAVANDGI